LSATTPEPGLEIIILLRVGDVDPDEVTHELGCTPTKSHRKGDPKHPEKTDSPAFKNHGWSIEWKTSSYSKYDDTLAAVTEWVRRRLDGLKRLATRGSVGLVVVVYREYCNPGAWLDEELVSLLGQIPASIELDAYVLGNAGE